MLGFKVGYFLQTDNSKRILVFDKNTNGYIYNQERVEYATAPALRDD